MGTDVFGFIASCVCLIILREKKEYVRWIFIFLSTVQLSKTYKHPSLILSMIVEGRQNWPRFLKPLSRLLICLYFQKKLMNFLIKLPAYNIFGWTITMIRANKTGIHLLWSIPRNFTLTESEVHSFKTLFQKSKLVVKL